MGIFRALSGAAASNAADAWREYFYCEKTDPGILTAKAEKRISEGSANTKGGENIISSGSVIAVNEGQCALVINNGTAEGILDAPGEYEYEGGTASILGGSSLKSVLSDIGRRISFGGDAPYDQRVYYINIKECGGNPFSASEIIRIHDKNTGLDADMRLYISGVFSFRIKDCVKFFKKVCGNCRSNYKISELMPMLRDEFISGLYEITGKILSEGERPSEIPLKTDEICSKLNKNMSDRWTGLRGIEIVSIGFDGFSLDPEDADSVKQLQKTAVYKDSAMAAAGLTDAMCESMKNAAENTGGAVGLMWLCSCGKKCTTPFCPDCGRKRTEGWFCSCGTYNTGNFCTECGRKKENEFN